MARGSAPPPRRVESGRAPAPSTVAAIASSIAVLAVATVLTKSFALGKELVLASSFGTAPSLEAYLLALVVCNFLIGLVAHSLPTAFVPVLVRQLEQGRVAAARALVSGTSVIAVGAGLVCALTIALSADALAGVLGGGFDPATRELAGELLFRLAPVVPLAGLGSVLGAILHARRRFWAVSLVPACTPIAIVFALVLGVADVELLTTATVVGAIAEAALLAALVARAGLLVPRWTGVHDPELREVVRGYVPLLLGAAVLGLVPVCDRAIAATVGAGAVATLAYAGRLVDPLLATGATAIGTAMLPHAARSLAQGGHELLGVSLRLGGLVLATSVPLVVGLVLGSRAIVELLFARGAFTEADAAAVASVQAVLALQIPIYLVGMIAARVLAAAGRVRVLVLGNAAALALTVTLDLALVDGFGVRGIAIATVVMRAITVGWLLFACLRALRPREAQP